VKSAKASSAADPGPRLNHRQRLAWLRLIRSENVGPATFRALVNEFGGAEAAIAALPMLSRRGGRTHDIGLCTEAEAEAELGRADSLGITLVALGEPGYPPALGPCRCAPTAALHQGPRRARRLSHRRHRRRPQRLGVGTEIHAPANSGSKASSLPRDSRGASTPPRTAARSSMGRLPWWPAASTWYIRRRTRSCRRRSPNAVFSSASVLPASRHAARTFPGATD
jgi:hypothetical protein